MDPAREGDHLSRRLVFLGKQLQRRFEVMLAEHDCTLPTWAVLRYVAIHPGLSQVELASCIGIEGPTLTRHLDRLCAEGLVARQRDERDRRVIRVSLTAAGKARWADLHTIADAQESYLTGHLTAPQRRALSDAITTITTAMEDHHALA